MGVTSPETAWKSQNLYHVNTFAALWFAFKWPFLTDGDYSGDWHEVDMPKILKSRSDRQCSDTGRFIYFWTILAANQLVRVLQPWACFTLFFDDLVASNLKQSSMLTEKTGRFLIKITDWTVISDSQPTCPPGLTERLIVELKKSVKITELDWQSSQWLQEFYKFVFICGSCLY